MTRIHRFIALALSGALLISGFAIGRWTTPTTVSATERSAATVASTSTAQPNSTEPGNENASLYLSDYKAGYKDGFHSGVSGQGTGLANSSRAGYNEGFSEGYANSHQVQLRPQPVQLNAFAPTDNEREAVRSARVSRSSRTVYYEQRPRHSKLKTALTIAAPAALGAGIGALAGGKKGAGVGALVGGGGGALYHLFKNRK